MAQQNTTFDFIESAVDGYRFLWRDRAELLRVALLPLIVKFVSYLAIVFMELDENYLRQGLVLVPSYFAEGWFVAYAMRLALLRETWYSYLTGDAVVDQCYTLMRKRLMHISVGIYVLMKLLSAMVVGLAMQEYQASEAVVEQTKAQAEGAFVDY